MWFFVSHVTGYALRGTCLVLLLYVGLIGFYMYNSYMNEIQIAIFFLVLSFAGSLLFATKKKASNAASFFINLDLEYIFIGLIVFLMASSYGVHGGAQLKPYLSLIMSFMGLLIDSQFSIKLLRNVNYRLFLILGVIYGLTHLLLYGVFLLFDFEHPYLVAIVINTAMPYSVQLFGRLHRVPMKYLFYILLYVFST